MAVLSRLNVLEFLLTVNIVIGDVDSVSQEVTRERGCRLCSLILLPGVVINKVLSKERWKLVETKIICK